MVSVTGFRSIDEGRWGAVLIGRARSVRWTMNDEVLLECRGIKVLSQACSRRHANLVGCFSRVGCDGLSEATVAKVWRNSVVSTPCSREPATYARLPIRVLQAPSFHGGVVGGFGYEIRVWARDYSSLVPRRLSLARRLSTFHRTVELSAYLDF